MIKTVYDSSFTVPKLGLQKIIFAKVSYREIYGVLSMFSNVYIYIYMA